MKCFSVISLEGQKKFKKHFNQNKEILDRSLNLRSQSAKQASHPLKGEDRWFVKRLSKCVFTFWTTYIPLLSSQASFLKRVFPTIWRLSLGHLCQSDTLPVSSNGGWSEARKLFFAGCLTYISAWTTLWSLTTLATSILASNVLNTTCQVRWDSYIFIFCDKCEYIFFRIIYRFRQFSVQDFCACNLRDFLFRAHCKCSIRFTLTLDLEQESTEWSCIMWCIVLM
jgi:hypothetical protein